MIEVGTTNKTHPNDYLEAIGPDTALLLKVHRSNFQIVGFSDDVETSELVELAGKYSLPVIEDLGSGCLVDLSKYGLIKEPTVQEVLAEGVDLVTFSGDIELVSSRSESGKPRANALYNLLVDPIVISITSSAISATISSKSAGPDAAE